MFPFVNIALQKVPLKGSFAASELAKVVSFQPFQDWVQVFSEQQKTRQNEMNVDSIDVQSIDYFGSEKIGFVKFKANVAFKETGKSAPGIVFMRGGAVSMMIILRAKDEQDKIILTLQPRVPVPHLSFPELPAGMLDGSGNFAGTAAKEIKEETGIEIKEDELIDMTQLAYGDKWKGVYPSAGGSDEFLRLFVCIKHMEKDEINKLEGKLTGLRDQGESITLKLVPFKDAWKLSPDAKLLSSLALYHSLGDKIC
ncbi:hypothetical protein BDF21DRAFT_424164 [Thamnidium elegans]|uniref:Nudix hydrolase domain-containing protein n=1 Tax=Thamnidium elegans TaxID=101142 RepID=A0A8H7SKQ3_9FUNG|nr:hypothetical protein INT48_001609 [Thamnidium elegans]KAI8073748.1 hypothetical protein BDF21DRAFT_424164 [Thamnidium elegans]